MDEEARCYICWRDEVESRAVYECAHWHCLECHDAWAEQPCPRCMEHMKLRWIDGPTQLFVRDLDGKTTTLHVNLDRTTWACLEAMVRQKRALVYPMKFVYQGRHCPPDFTLKRVGVVRDSTVHMVGVLRGD